MTHLVSELQVIEEQLENKLDSTLDQTTDLSITSKAVNEFENFTNENLNDTQQLDDHLQQEEILQPTGIDALAQDIDNYRRDSQLNLLDSYVYHTERRPSSPPASPLYKQEFVHVTCSSMNDVDRVQEKLLHEQEENRVLQDLISTIITEAQKTIQSNVSITYVINNCSQFNQ